MVNGINAFPNQFTGGEGPVSGQEVMISVNFTTPILLDADHYFFRPEALLSSGDFLWLSAPRPQFTGDLQSWMRNDNLAPDWSRIGTDITNQGPFDASFLAVRQHRSRAVHLGTARRSTQHTGLLAAEV